MASGKIMIVDDDRNICELLRLYIEKEGFETAIANDGKAAVQMFDSVNPDLMLLDIMLPELDGWQVCREIRKKSQCPIIMLTAKGEVFDKVLGLELGADDYIEKPFSPSVLVARVKAHLAQYHLLKPKTAAAPKLLTVGPLSADPAQHCIRKNDAELALKNKEYELLLFLMRHPGQVFSREDLYEMIWGLESMGDNITVAVHMNRLREKIEDDPSHPTLLQTVWGVGYRLNKGER